MIDWPFFRAATLFFSLFLLLAVLFLLPLPLPHPLPLPPPHPHPPTHISYLFYLISPTVKEWGQKILWGICCCLCTGPIMTLIGIIFVVSAIKDERGDNVDKFNEGITTFMMTRPAWAARTFTSDSFGGNVLASLTSEPFEVEDSELLVWDALIYEATGTPAGFPTSLSTTAPSSVSIDFQEGGTTLSGAGAIAPNGVVVRSGSTTTSTSGSNTSPTPPPPPSPPMATWTILTRVCRKVGNGAAYGTGGPGCFASVEASNGAEYSTCGTVLDTANGPSACTNYNVQAHLRSDDDPVVLGFANDACGRSADDRRCSFGISRGTKLVIALIFLVIGITWTCCVYGGLYGVILYFQKRQATNAIGK